MSIKYAACLGFFLFGTMGFFNWSLHRNERVIEKSLLEITPIGTPFETAADILTKRFGHIQKNAHSGFLRQDSPKIRVVGVQSISVELGDYYHFPMGTTSVTAFLGFDGDGKLIEIWVWKTTDSL